jgi:hypothetical protein
MSIADSLIFDDHDAVVPIASTWQSKIYAHSDRICFPYQFQVEKTVARMPAPLSEKIKLYFCASN